MKYPLLFKAIVGSQSYGTAIPTSDIDRKGVYIQPVSDLITFNYKEQIDVGKDETYYEVRRFLQLLETANPTVLELLFSPEDCIIEKSPAFDLIVKHRQKFLTKKCLNSFGGYAVAQIKKAKGLDKKMNWEKSKVIRKTPLDFVFVYENGKTMPVDIYLKREGLKQEYCGLIALNHFKDCYAMYYDYNAHHGPTRNRPFNPLGFHGITLANSNDIRLSSVPKGIEANCIVYYSKDSYSRHCNMFKEYQDWLNNRNTQRYVDTEIHGQQIDGKNLMHCRRLLDVAIEIAREGTINVRRSNADYLLKIRRGEVNLEELIQQAELDIKGLDLIYEKANLPEEVDKSFVNDLLLEIRNY